MAKQPTLKSAERRTGKTMVRRSKKRNEQLTATLASLDQLQPSTPQAAKVIALLRSWLTDESGYDEKAWPALKKALDRERARVGARRLFDD